MRYRARMRQKKQKAARKLLDEERNTEIPIHSPFKKSIQIYPHPLYEEDLE